MASDPNVMVHFKDVEVDETLRGLLERRCRALLEEFPEVTHLELGLEPDGLGLVASAKATGKDTEAATHATADEPRPAADQVLARMRKQLRSQHDKRIFAHRRTAQKTREARRGPAE